MISTVAPSLGHIEDAMVSLGYTLISISPHSRSPSNTFVLERNVPKSPLGAYKSPNCVACGLTPVLAAMFSNAGEGAVERLTVTTLQSLTGRGDSPYPSELCVGSTLPVGKVEETEGYLVSELAGMFSAEEGSGPKVDVRCYRGGALRGHLIDLRVDFKEGEQRDLTEEKAVG